MGCSSCGGGGAAMRVGNTHNNAILFGEPDGDIRRVRFNSDTHGIQAGAVKYVRGSGVQGLIDDGVVSVLAGGSYSAPSMSGMTFYYVDGVGYATMEAARLRAGQTGKEIIVKTFGE